MSEQKTSTQQNWNHLKWHLFSATQYFLVYKLIMPFQVYNWDLTFKKLFIIYLMYLHYFSNNSQNTFYSLDDFTRDMLRFYKFSHIFINMKILISFFKFTSLILFSWRWMLSVPVHSPYIYNQYQTRCPGVHTISEQYHGHW